MAKERTRDDLIDSIIHTRTKEHRVMPGFLTASRSLNTFIACLSSHLTNCHFNCSWEERKAINIDCDKVYPGIFIANGETIQGQTLLR